MSTILFDENDANLIRVRELAHRLPNVLEKVSHGRLAFYTKKVFVYYGGAVKADDGWIEHGQSMVFLADPDERPALLGDPRFYLPAYLGPYGWVGMDLFDDTDWSEVVELVETSYRLTAPKRSIDQLGQQSG